MRIPGFGLEIRRMPKLAKKYQGMLQNVSGRGGWWPIVRESVTGAWQRNITVNNEDVITNPIVWACATLIASDISKLWLNLVERDANGIWTETESSAFSPVLRTPNRHTTRVKFYEYWMLSKLLRGNTFALKDRDDRGMVKQLYVLDSSRVQVLCAPDGSLFYQLSADMFAGIEHDITVPARDIIHDIMVPLFSPYIGVSPIFAAGMAAMQGLKIQQQSALLFANGSNPGGVLTSPHAISNEAAERIKTHWESNYSGAANVGRVAVLGDGLTYEPMTMTAVDAQLIDQLRWSDERICACFHVPGYKVGIGPPPPYTDIESINLSYYQDALQNPIENLEELLDKGLEMPTAPRHLGTEFDIHALARMDTKTQVENSTKGILGGLFTPNEERKAFDRKPVDGGDTVYLQQQQYSLSALSRRDLAAPAPDTPAVGEPAPTKALPPVVDEDGTDDFLALFHQKTLRTDFYDAA